MNNQNFGEFCWNELATANVHAAKHFYSTLLGWQFEESIVGDYTYTMIKLGNNTCGGIWEIPTAEKETIPPHWMSYILVEDIEKTTAHAVELGATVRVPITAVGDFGRFSLIVDPTGASIAFWQCIQQCEKDLDKALENTFPASDPTAQY